MFIFRRSLDPCGLQMAASLHLAPPLPGARLQTPAFCPRVAGHLVPPHTLQGPSPHPLP